VRDLPDRSREGPSEDGDLVARVAAGSVESLAHLYDRHAASMLGLAVRMLGCRRDAEDLLHDVFLEVWRRSASYDPSRASVRTWLLVKIRSRAMDRFRSLAAARRRGFDAGVEPPDTEDLDLHLEILRSVDHARALTALDALPDSQQVVVRLVYLQGLSCAEIARECDLPIGTVKSRLARGLAALRERMPAAEGE
jgi:RNA polymerase sigma-70 factor, ECF subfamily